MEETEQPTLTVRPNGPYLLSSQVPVRRSQIVHSEHGEPMTYDSEAPLDTGQGLTALCRCGASDNKPFCDGTHTQADWDGTEAQRPSTYDERATDLGGSHIQVSDDRSICVHAGFCGNRVANVWKLVDSTDDSITRIQVMNMVERCPSGALTYTLEDGEEPNEPDLPTEVAVLTDGPLYLQGNIIVVSSDGDDHEIRNRVTLCRCGESANKPYCDGQHKDAGFQD